MPLLAPFLNATASTEAYTLSLHDALPIYRRRVRRRAPRQRIARPTLRPRATAVPPRRAPRCSLLPRPARPRSEEHTSELQSLAYLVCRLLLDKINVKPPQQALLALLHEFR